MTASLHSPPAALARRRQYAAVLFDLDGTLLDTVPDLAAAANRMLAELGQAQMAESAIASFVGQGIAKLVERILERATGKNLPAPHQFHSALTIFERCYAEESGRRSRPYPGVASGLQRLHRAGMPMGVVTNKASRFTLALLNQTAWKACFGVVVCGDTLPARKPDPLPVLYACERLGVAPNRTLFIGDSKHDVAAARGAGCAIWCVPYGYNEGAPADRLQSDGVVSDVETAAMKVLRALD